MGFEKGWIEHRLRTGRLHRVHAGVYAVGHSITDWRGPYMAAVLACGPSAVVSHRSAAAVHALRPDSRNVVNITVPGRSRHGIRGVNVHRVRSLHHDDRTAVDGIPVTSVARTIFDSAEVLNRRQLERMFEEAERRQLLDLCALEALCERSPGRRGLNPIHALLAEANEPPPTRSDFERDFLDVCKDAGLPLPIVNAVVLGYEVDMFWPEQELIVELDSRAWHSSATAFEQDRIRDTELQLAGFLVIRVTYRRLSREPATVVRDVRRGLDRDRARAFAANPA
jgi:hypothetical protein